MQIAICNEFAELLEVDRPTAIVVELRDHLIQLFLVRVLAQLGQREVELAVRRRLLNEQDGVEFSVRDTGGGIASEDMDRVYEAFFSTKAEGLGLGLKLGRSIVESHGGRLQVSNLYNNSQIAGCCFTFWLPLQAAAAGIPPATPPISEKSETQ